jgi:nucleoside-diphosphate kinase
MALERTLSIIKPDAVEKHHAGAILALLEKEGFVVKAMKRIHLTRAEAEGFYAEHKARGFFGELVDFMSRSPIIILALEREDAVAKYREVIGATDPGKAAEGTIRKLYGASVGENAAHGSDKTETAAREIGYFFAGYEVSPTP